MNNKDSYLRLFDFKFNNKTLNSYLSFQVNEKDDIEYHYISDDYDKNYSFWQDHVNCIYALNHALDTVAHISNNPNEILIEETIQSLTNDLRNFLELRPNLLLPAYSNLYHVIDAIIYLQGYDQLLEVLSDAVWMTKYDDNLVEPGTSKNKIDITNVLNLKKSLLKGADKALLVDKYPITAMHMYDIAEVNWGIDISALNSNQIKSISDIFEICEEVQSIYKLNITSTKLKLALKNPSIVDSFETIRNNIFHNELEAQLELCLTDYYNFTENVYLKCSIPNPKVRACVAGMYAFQRSFLMDVLDDLSERDLETRQKYMEAVWNCVLQNSTGRFDSLRLFLTKRVCDFESFEDLLLLSKVCLICENIKKQLKVTDHTKNIAYYTSLETFSYMLPQKRNNEELSRDEIQKLGKLSIMNVSYMNDPNEGRTLLNVVGSAKAMSQDMRRNVTIPYVFLKCFTDNIDYLPMWEMYANHAEGCCIVLDTQHLLRAQGVALYKVCYINNKGKLITKAYNLGIDCPTIETCIKELKICFNSLKLYDAKQSFLDVLGDVKYLFKDAAYSYEHELRIMYSFSKADLKIEHTPGTCPKLFIYTEVPVQIKELILGPKFKDLANKIPYIQEQVERMCVETGTNMPVISISNIEYR